MARNGTLLNGTDVVPKRFLVISPLVCGRKVLDCQRGLCQSSSLIEYNGPGSLQVSNRLKTTRDENSFFTSSSWESRSKLVAASEACVYGCNVQTRATTAEGMAKPKAHGHALMSMVIIRDMNEWNVSVNGSVSQTRYALNVGIAKDRTNTHVTKCLNATSTNSCSRELAEVESVAS